MKSIAIGPIVKLAMTMVTATLFSTGASAADVRVLHNFGGSATDGANPVGALIIDKDGNLYGTTEDGGARDGGGTVFRLTRKEDGEWTETVLHSFGFGDDGSVPKDRLVFDAFGNLYGVTETGGTHNMGTIFELSPAEGGKWTETVLHSFNVATDGEYPQAPLILDAAGNLFGTVPVGGSKGGGTVFELTPGPDGWTEWGLNRFATDHGYPNSGVILDAAGNLYGTAVSGGDCGGGDCNELGEGSIFKLIRGKGGQWTEKVLHNFGSSPTGGQFPYGGLIFDKSGNLFGTTSNGGATAHGEIFEFSPDGEGSWTHTVLHEFDYSNGSEPEASLVMDAAGNLYGTTSEGGSHGVGTVFEVIF